MNEKVTLVARLILGLILLVFGLNKFFNFMPTPDMPPEAGALMGAFAEAGYMFPMIALVEIITGALLLIGILVPLALVLLAPLSVNIILFHLALAPGGIIPGLIVFALNAYLLFAYIDCYKPLLQVKQGDNQDTKTSQMPSQ